jgi:hypothetical protein
MATASETNLPEADSTKFEQIAMAIRRGIVRGELLPGSRLPTWDVLSERYQVGRPTLMRALNRLKRDGFVYASSTRGTFVSERPPHLTRYGLVFAASPGETGDRGWNRFWGALADEAVIISQRGELSVECFYGTGRDGSDALDRLSRELSDHRLAGLVLVATSGLIRQPLFADPAVPTVAIFNGNEGPPLPRLYVDFQSFIDRSLDHLLSLGRRNVAVLVNEGPDFNGYAAAIAARGMNSKPAWQLAASSLHPHTARGVVRLLLDRDNTRRPDALVIADDNLVEHALSAVVESGVRVPDELEIVTHCNWPWPVSSVLPVRRLGYDARELLERALGLVSAPAVPPPPRTLLAARFENEVRA